MTTTERAATMRREDPRLLLGATEFTDDLSPPDVAHAAILRSRYGHARIESIDTGTAESREGVIAVYTADDLTSRGEMPTIPVWGLPPQPEGPDDPFRSTRELHAPDRPLLATDAVRYVGEPLAIVLAEERYLAHDALDLIEVAYDREPSVTDPAKAVAGDAPAVHEGAPDNVAFEWEIGDEEAVEGAFEVADHTISLDVVNQRVLPNPIEPRCVLADYDAPEDKLRMTMSTQTPHHIRTMLSGMLELPEHRIRVIAPDVGGGFGAKSKYYAAEGLVSWCSRELRRPVKWVATRSETHVTDVHGRGHDTTAELAVDADGTFRGLRARTVADMGAYLSKVSPSIATRYYATMLSMQYVIPEIYCHVTGAFTNTTPTDAYRGAGRPEAAFALERLVDIAARELDLDPADLRRRNLIPADAFPYQTPIAAVYDSGEYERALDLVLEQLPYDDLRKRQAELRQQDRYLGIGFGCYVENSGSAPGEPGDALPLMESSLVRVHPSGTVTVYTGTAEHGQGHKTAFAGLVSDELGIPDEDVEVIEGDTDLVPQGTGTFGSRSGPVGGGAIAQSARKIVEKGKRIAANELETSIDDIEFEDGEFYVTGARDRHLHLREVAAKAYTGELPPDIEPGLQADAFYSPSDFTYSFGTHAAVVEVDPVSGEIELERFVAVDDCGVQLNPTIVEGQVHGAVAQGIGQALYEGVVYDEAGTLLTGSFQDYVMPRAAHLPELETTSTVTPSPHNPVGAKGIGEGGAAGAPPAIVNAIVDALAPLGVEHLEMPVTSERVWQAVQDAEPSD